MGVNITMPCWGMSGEKVLETEAGSGLERSGAVLFSVTDGRIWGCSNAKVLFEECEEIWKE
jgi:hypothetical protein